jgi:two-component system, NtrC family, response regulator AtoC
MLHALLVDDDVNFALGLAEVVGREGFGTKTAHTLKEAKAEIAKSVPDVLLVDLHLPDGSGLDLFRELDGSPGAEIILITGQATVDTAVEAMRRGASDYLIKPVDFSRVKQVLTNVARTRELKEQIGNLRGELRKLGRFGPLIGASPPMQRVYDLIAKVAQTDATVMLTGETGTGKELVAETVHSLSRRHKEPFLPINCGAVSPNLIESELFGHERGSFTGADRMHRGYYERAHRGTLFLDEITEIPHSVQVKLLRAIQEREIRRVGDTRDIKIEVRLVTASNRDPAKAVASGDLREDLYYRLNVIPIHLPPLRERREDISLLARHFIAELSAEYGKRPKELTREVLDLLVAQPWPGNVRELRNIIERLVIMTPGDRIEARHLPASLVGAAPAAGEPPSASGPLPAPVSDFPSLAAAREDFEKRYIWKKYQECGGNMSRTSEALQVERSNLYRKMKGYGLIPARKGEAIEPA